MGRTHRSPGYSFLLVLGLFVVLGHVCALPGDATGVAALVGHTHAAHDEPSADDSVHGASCEAVRSTFTVTPPVLLTAPTAPARLLAHSLQRTLDRQPPVFALSPPLFLLHAALLI